MITSEFIKQKARELGATVCGIGKIYDEPDIQRDPKMILPNAKCIIGFGFAVPKGIYKAMDRGTQYYTYTSLGVKYIDEEMAEIFLLKIGGLIENEGYDACLQKAIPNLRIKGDKTTNPEVVDTYELISDPVEEGKPAPDVYLYAAKQVGKNPSDTYAVEDSPNGVMSAHSAGCKTIMIPDQTLPDDELKSVLYKEFSSLKDLLTIF